MHTFGNIRSDLNPSPPVSLSLGLLFFFFALNWIEFTACLFYFLFETGFYYVA